MLYDLLGKLQNNRKVHLHLRNISKFDVPSLRSVGRTIAAIVDKKITFEDPFLRNFTMTPAEREEYDRKKNEERQRMEEIKQARIETSEKIKKEKQESFEKLKDNLLRQVAREPYKISPVFDFVEPAPGCHYDIGPSFGYVVIPIPFVDYSNPDEHERMGIDGFLNDVHEYTFLITKQLFDNLGGGKVDIQIITVEE